MPVSISSFVAENVTVLPTTTGMSPMFWTSSSKIRPFSLREMWRALVTVDCTTKTSTPASRAMRRELLRVHRRGRDGRDAAVRP